MLAHVDSNASHRCPLGGGPLMRETVEREKPSSVPVIDTLKLVRLARALKWHRYIIQLSTDLRLKNPSLTCLIEVYLSGEINKGS
jgi:hypothetical protein